MKSTTIHLILAILISFGSAKQVYSQPWDCRAVLDQVKAAYPIGKLSKARANTLLGRLQTLPEDCLNEPAVSREVGMLLYRLGRHEDAEVQFRKTLANDPNDAGVMSGLAVLLYIRGNLEEATDVFYQLLSLEPDRIAERETLARALAMLGRQSEYEEQGKILESLRGRAYTEASNAVRQGNVKEGIKIAEKGLSVEGLTELQVTCLLDILVKSYMSLGDLELGNSRYDSAIELYTAALRNCQRMDESRAKWSKTTIESLINLAQERKRKRAEIIEEWQEDQ